jgi:uncharacterized membrane protein YgdD (TMEM256/DUF423 family)
MIILAIILGAFGAHALKERLEPEQLQSFEVGVKYQVYHGLALLILGMSSHKISFSIQASKVLIILGVVFFSGSIYLLSIQDIIGVKLSFLGPITPIGGLLLITAWVVFLINVLRMNNEKDSLS